MIEEKDKDFSIYEVPLSLTENKLDELIVEQLNLPAENLDLDRWRDLIHTMRNPEHEISIAVVGKYAEHRDAYKSIYEALDHAGIDHRCQVRVQRIQSEAIEQEGPERLLSGYDGLLVPGGFGERGIEGKVEAIRFARERDIPFFGICLGMQCAAIEFARHVVGLDGAHSTEFSKDTPHPIICLLDEQKTITDKGGTMRLGAQPATPRGRQQSGLGLRKASHQRATSASLRVQQSLPPAVFGQWPAILRHEPRWFVGRDHRIGTAPLVRCRAVPSRVQVEAHQCPSLVRRLHWGRPREASFKGLGDTAGVTRSAGEGAFAGHFTIIRLKNAMPGSWCVWASVPNIGPFPGTCISHIGSHGQENLHCESLTAGHGRSVR